MEKIILKVSKDDEDVAYIYLPKHPKKMTKGIINKQIELSNLIADYKGPDIYLDFDSDDILIGIEIIG